MPVRSEPIGLLRQLVGEVHRGLRGLVLGETVFSHEARQKGAVDSTRHIMTRRNGQKGARIVVEAHGVVETGALRRLLAKASQALGAVVKPPSRPELEHR